MIIALSLLGLFLFVLAIGYELIRFCDREMKLAFLIEEKALYEQQRAAHEREAQELSYLQSQLEAAKAHKANLEAEARSNGFMVRGGEMV